MITATARVVFEQRRLRRSAGVGQPPRWTKYDDASDAHHFKEDVFDSIENVQKAAGQFKTLHNGKLERRMFTDFYDI